MVGVMSRLLLCVLYRVRGSLGNAEDQISNGVGVGIGATPAHRFTRGRAHPDHTFLAPCLSDAEGVVHVGRPVATVGVKVGPGGGLDCDGVGHGSFVCCVYCTRSGGVMEDHIELVAVHVLNDRLGGGEVRRLPLNLGRASAVAALEIDGEVEGGHGSFALMYVL